MRYECCRWCVPPKRNEYCHSNCPEYTEARAKHDEDNAIMNQAKAVKGGLIAQTLRGVNRAEKARKKSKGR